MNGRVQRFCPFRSIGCALLIVLLVGAGLTPAPRTGPAPAPSAVIDPALRGTDTIHSPIASAVRAGPDVVATRIAPPGPAVRTGSPSLSVGLRPVALSGSPSLPAVNMTPLYPQEADAGLAYDSGDKYTLLYTAECCGPNSGQGEFSWAINGTSIRLVATPTSPDILGYSGENPLTDDPHDGYVVLFGGTNESGNQTNQTWAYHAGKWTRLLPTLSPPSNVTSVSAYDPAIAAIVLLAWTLSCNPSTGTCTYSNQTWTFSGGTWTKVLSQTPAGFPGSPVGMAYDSTDGYLMAYGGYAGNATWKYQGSTWTRVATTGSPPAYNVSTLADDNALGKVLLFGQAFPVNGTWHNATWGYSGGHWAALTGHYLDSPTFMTPTAPNGSLVAYLPPGRPVPSPGSGLSPIWILKNSTWVSPSGMPRAPSSRCCGQSTYDAADGYFLTYGGVAFAGVYNYITLNDTWAFQNGKWNQLHPATSPPGMYYGSLAYDPTDGYSVLLGGAYGSPYYSTFDQTWTYLAGKWTQLQPARYPDSPVKGCMAWDPSDGYLVYWGGINGSGDVNKTWKFLHGNWTQLSTAGAPPPSDGCALAYDAYDGYMVLWTASYTWRYSAGVWTNISTATDPQFRKQPFFGYAPTLGGIILYGGTSGGIAAREDLWLFSKGNWTELAEGMNPGWAGYGGCAFDPQVGGLVLFIGESNFDWLSQAWVLNLSLPLAAGTVAITPGSLDLGDSVTIRADPSGGTGVYSLNWTSLPPGCAGGNASVIHCTPTQSGNWPVNLTVKESSGGSAKAPAVYLAVAADPSVSAVTAAPSLLDVGMSTKLSANETGGTAPFTYSWSGLPSGCTSTNARSLSCYPAAAGNYSITVQVVDHIGYAAYRSTNLTVHGPLVINDLRSSAAVMDLGQTVTFTTSSSGGTGSDSYTWTGLPPGCSASNVTSVSCTPSATGYWGIRLTVTDALGSAAYGGPLGLTVNPQATAPTLSLTRPAADAGQSIVAGATPAGGSSPYTYAWSTGMTGCGAMTQANLTCVPGLPGNYSVQVSVTDATGVTETSGSAMVTILTDPTVSDVSATRSSADVGQSVVFSVTVAFGAGGYSYAWGGLPAGCHGTAGSPVVPCVPAAPGGASIVVNVSDSNGYSVLSAPLVYPVYSDPTVAPPTPSRSSTDVGQFVTFHAVTSPGSGGDQYTWTGICSGAAPEATCRPVQSGALSEQIVLTDSNGASAIATAPYVVQPAPRIGAAVPSRLSLDVGQSVTFNTTVGSPGSGQPVIQWTGESAALACGTTSGVSVTCTGAGPGSSALNATLVDSNGGTATTMSAEVTVLADPLVGAPAVSPAVIDANDSTTFNVAVAGGTGAYQFVWTGLPAGCTAGPASFSCRPTISGRFTPSVTVTDGNGFSATSSTGVLQVDPALSGSESSSLTGATVGTVLSFAAGAAGGSGVYRFDWAFGDGTVGSGKSVTHSFSTVGTFEVRLWINDTIGGVLEKSEAVTITPTGSAAPSTLLGIPSPWGFLLVAELAVIALAAVAAVLGRSRRSGGEPSPATEPEGELAPPSEPEPGEEGSPEGEPDARAG